MASARDATRRATRSCSAAFAFVAVVSALRCAWETSESRRSATQRIPVARAIAAAIRCVEPGGDVETTTSIPCSRTSLIPAGIAVSAQVAFSSGITRRLSWSRARVSGTLEPLRAGEDLGRACRRSHRGSARGAPMPETAAEGPRLDAASAGRRVRGRASRSPSPGGTARTSAVAARRLRLPGGSRS